MESHNYCVKNVNTKYSISALSFSFCRHDMGLGGESLRVEMWSQNFEALLPSYSHFALFCAKRLKVPIGKCKRHPRGK